MNILMIDDNKDYQYLVKEYINLLYLYEKWNIDTSETLENSFKKMKNKKYDVILLDLCLSKTRGMETIIAMFDFLKKSKQNQKIPVIILTNLEDFAIGKKTLEIGAYDFLIKEKVKSQQLYRAITFATYNDNMPERPFYSRKKRKFKK